MLLVNRLHPHASADATRNAAQAANISSGRNQPGQSSTQDNNAVQNEKPTDPNLPKTQPEINKLQKGERTSKSNSN